MRIGSTRKIGAASIRQRAENSKSIPRFAACVGQRNPSLKIRKLGFSPANGILPLIFS